MVGNGVTDEVYDGNALVPFAHGMGLISDKIYEVSFIFIFSFNLIFLLENILFLEIIYLLFDNAFGKQFSENGNTKGNCICRKQKLLAKEVITSKKEMEAVPQCYPKLTM